MPTTYQLHKILFLDIETVSQYSDFNKMPKNWQSLWTEKTRYQRAEDESAEDFYPKRAAILAEFGKVVCISCGYFKMISGKWQFRSKSFFGNNEKAVLKEFSTLLTAHFQEYLLCAHNGKEFDFPYLSRRLLINNLDLPKQLDNGNAKPWEIPHIDTLEMWKFGDRKNFTSLKLLAAIFDIPTPKDDIDGSMVGEVYWQENDLERIKLYCEKDTVTLAKVFIRIAKMNIQDFEIISADG